MALTLKERIAREANELGFAAVRFASADPPPGAGAALAWAHPASARISASRTRSAYQASSSSKYPRNSPRCTFASRASLLSPAKGV